MAVVDITASSKPADRARRPSTIGWRRWLPAVPFGLLLLLTIAGPLLMTHDPRSVVGLPSAPPSTAHWFGTDANGMDVWSRTIASARLDVGVAVGATVLSTVTAMCVGLFSGMNESRPGLVGALARGLARSVDLLQAVPAIILGVVLLSFFGRTTGVLVLALSVMLLPLQARLVRTEVLRVRTEGYVDAARMAGESETRLLFRHVLPNSSAAALENTSTVFAVVIIYTAAMGFLGAGVPFPEPEWGSMLAAGATDAVTGRWWSALFPSLALAAAVAAATGAVHAAFGSGRRDR